MSLVSEWVRYGERQEYSGYLAYPKRAPLPLPGIVVIQEAWGVDTYLEDVTQRLAKAGYVAFAPDLYARDGSRAPLLSTERIARLQAFVNELPPGVWQDTSRRDEAIAGLPDPARSELKETHGAFTQAVSSDKHLEPLTAATRYLRDKQPATRGQKLGSVGFCLGGGLSARLAAADPELKAAVIFYGTSPSDELVPKIQAPLLGFYGEQDPRINSTIPAFAAAAERHGKSFEQHIYPGAQHAFFNNYRPSYNLAAARDAFVRTLGFFQKHLT
jgi:carboxymethylenebutenolidase